jgi:hypothetical protein
VIVKTCDEQVSVDSIVGFLRPEKKLLNGGKFEEFFEEEL